MDLAFLHVSGASSVAFIGPTAVQEDCISTYSHVDESITGRIGQLPPFDPDRTIL